MDKVIQKEKLFFYLVSATQIFYADSFSQNLVPNPSLEVIALCPIGNSSLFLATPWDDPPGSITSTDLFNTCNTVASGCNHVDVPTNFTGAANAFDGVGYAGLLTYYTNCPNCREYMTAPLTSPLTAGTQYCVSFRVLRGSYSRYATNNIGAYISAGAPTQPSNQPILVTPQLEITTLVGDSLNWTLVSGLYTAAGGEDYITLGNFHDNINNIIFDYGVSSATCALGWAAAYYYFDSISVQTCSTLLPVASFSVSNTTICAGDCINFTDQSNGLPTGWNWSFPGGNPNSSVAQNPSGICYNTAGTYTATLTASNANGSDTATIVIVVNAPPSASITGNLSVCAGSGSTLTANPSGAAYLWSNGSSSQTIIVSPTASSSYSVIASLGSCSDTATVTVFVNPVPTAAISGNSTICSGQNATLTASGGGNYFWTTGQTSASVSVSPAATTNYSVIVSIGSCADTASVTVTVLPSASASVSGSTTICLGQSATLTSSGGTNYSWSNGNLSSAISVNPASSTTYTVIVSSGSCSDTATVNVNVIPSVIASVSGNINLCMGQTATLTAAGGITYSWNTGATSTSINPSSAGTYSVIASIGSCADTASVTVTVNPLPSASAWPDTTIDQGQSVTLSASGGGTYNWNNGSAGAVISASPNSTTIYCVTVTDANNCTDIACVTVIVNPPYCPGEPYLPNAFSPNDDGENEEFKIYYGNILCIRFFELVIYNRWGESVFESTDPSFKWNGTHRNKKLDTGVFTYHLSIVLADKKEIFKKGNVSLIR